MSEKQINMYNAIHDYLQHNPEIIYFHDFVDMLIDEHIVIGKMNGQDIFDFVASEGTVFVAEYLESRRVEWLEAKKDVRG